MFEIHNPHFSMNFLKTVLCTEFFCSQINSSFNSVFHDHFEIPAYKRHWLLYRLKPPSGEWLRVARSSLPVLVSPTSVTCAAFLPIPKRLLLYRLPAPDHLTNPTPARTPAPALLCTCATGDCPSMAKLLIALGMCQLLTAVGPSSHEHPHHCNDYPSVQMSTAPTQCLSAANAASPM